MTLLCAAVFVILIFPFSASARTVADQPIQQRIDPALQPHGWHSGQTYFFPSLQIQQSYSDNLRASHFYRHADFITEIAPKLQIKLDKEKYGISSSAEIRHKAYLRMASENNTNAALSILSHYNLSRAMTMRGHLSYDYQHELHSADTSNPLASEPTPYDKVGSGLSLLYKPGRVGGEVFISHDRYSYRNVDLLTGGRFINDDRNRHITTVGAELTCDLSRTAQIGWRHEKFQQDYQRADHNVISGLYDGINRNNDGWRSQLAFSFKPSALWHISGRAGVEKRAFDYTPWPHKTVPVANLDILYLLTPLTNVTLKADRRVIDTAFDNTPAFTQQQVKIGVTHELRRNLVLNLDGGIGEADYWNHRLYGSAVGLLYKKNRFLQWQAGYRYQKRNSSIQEASYHENIITIGAQVQF